MGPAYFVIAILGCADGGSQCTPVATQSVRYATEDQCAAATGAALMNSQDFDFPTLVARCRAVTSPAAASGERGAKGPVSRG